MSILSTSSSSLPLTPSKLKIILPTLREAISNVVSSTTSSSSSSSSSIITASPVCLLLLCELTSRGIDISNFFLLSAVVVEQQQQQQQQTKDAYKNTNVEMEIQQIQSLLELIRNVAGKLPIDESTTTTANNNNNNGSGGVASSKNAYPAPMMAALYATSGMAATACFDSLSSSQTSSSNNNNLLLLLPHLDNPKIQDTITNVVRRCIEVNDGRFYTLLQLASLLSFQLQEGAAPGGDGNDTSITSSSLTNATATTTTLRQRQQQQQQRRLLLQASFHQIAYANYMYGASNFAYSLPNASQSMILWKKCLDVALLLSSSSSSSTLNDPTTGSDGDDDDGGGGGDIMVGDNGAVHSAITTTASRRGDGYNIITNTTTTTSSSSTDEEYQSYLTSSYYTILPLRQMIQIANSRNNVKRVAELNVHLSCAYLGYVYEQIVHLARDIHMRGGRDSSTGTTRKEGERTKEGRTTTTAATTTTNSLQQLSMNDLILKYYLRRSTALVQLQDGVSIEELLDCAEEALSSATTYYYTTTTTTEQEDGVVIEDNSGQQQQQRRQQQQQLLHQYIQVQIQHWREESKIWKEIQYRHLAQMNRRPDDDGVVSGSGANNGIGLGGGGGSSVTTTTFGLGGSTKKTTTTATTSTTTSTTLLEDQVRKEVYLQAWDAAWQAMSEEDGDTTFRDILNSLSPSCLALRDAVISFAASDSSIRGDGSASGIVQDCCASVVYQLKRLVEIAVAVSTASHREKRKDYDDASHIIWMSVLSFASSLMMDFLHHGHVVWVPKDDTNTNGASGDDKDDNDSVSALGKNAMRRHLMEYCSETIITAAWMCEPHMFVTATCDGPNNTIHVDELRNLDNILPRLLSMAHDCLTSCQKLRAVEEKERLLAERENQSVLSSKEKYTIYEQNEMLLFRYALAASTCRMDLVNACTMNTGGSEESLSSEQMLVAINTAARRATISATTAASTKSNKTDMKSPTSISANASSKFGTPYIQFLSAWSGMYNTPWPFCTLSQARTILRNAREALSVASKNWGRNASSIIERLMLDIGEADLEGILVGGFTDVAEKLYRKSLVTLTNENSGGDNSRDLLQVHCLIGLARIYLSKGVDIDLDMTEKYARDALAFLQSDSCGQKGQITITPAHLCIYAWDVVPLNQQSRSYHVSSARQLVAESCIHSRPEDARSFLTQAVNDYPSSSEAVLALASFHLRVMIGSGANDNEIMKAKTFLLKAAKMDTTKPDPFSLLGVWYELQNDTTRAKGCYQKALTMDPSHPVAGRGLQRLTSLDELRPFCRDALARNSPMNGWAWRILGQQQSRDEGDGTAALVCFQKALRCRDIQAPNTSPLGVFYIVPAPLGQRTHCEASETWAELAACYRRLGKFSAALRAFEAAYSVSDGHLSPDEFIAWAQVDLDLGLFEEAADTCAKVLALDSSLHVRRMATYIEGEALLRLARGRIQEGKFGSCLSLLMKGAARLKSHSSEETCGSTAMHHCELKLLGDIYSCGSSLPPYAFSPLKADEPLSHNNEEHFSRDVESKISFLMEGEHAYALAFAMANEGSDHDDDNKWLVAAAATDLGTNLLSQARVVQLALGGGSSQLDSTASAPSTIKSNRLRGLITRSVNAYLSAIDSSPLDASAWCGLGCALISVDPIVSQHAFCRGVQLDSSLADSWSNLSLLYASHDKKRSSEVLDQITQIEDTPLTWIGRGLLLEETAVEWNDDSVVKEACLTKAADAFRSALQIQQHPAALLGVSLNCRRTDPRLNGPHNVEYSYLADATTMFESRMSLIVHQTMSPGNIGASYLSGLAQIEEGLNRLNNCDCAEGATIVSEAITDLSNTVAKYHKSKEIAHNPNSELTNCEIDLIGCRSLRADKFEMYPDDAIKCVLDHSLQVASTKRLDDIAQANINELSEAHNKVLLNPDSGEAWLTFASRLAGGVSNESNDPNVLSSAKFAARRAYSLLHERVINATKMIPRRQTLQQGASIEYSDTSVISPLPTASLFSYSMVLVSLLEETAISGNPRCSDMTVATIQESLLLDPLNSTSAKLLNNHVHVDITPLTVK